jgi:hypothetical protein
MCYGIALCDLLTHQVIYNATRTQLVGYRLQLDQELSVGPLMTAALTEKSLWYFDLITKDGLQNRYPCVRTECLRNLQMIQFVQIQNFTGRTYKYALSLASQD